MRNLTFIAVMLAVTSASVVGAQASPAPVTVRPTIFHSIVNPKEDEFARDVAGTPNGKFIYYVTAGDVRLFDRAKKTTTVILKGEYTYVAVSTAGDRLVFLRPAEGAKPGPNRELLIWTMAVNPQTGAAAGEPRRVSMLPADAPRFSPDGSQIAFIAAGMPRKMMVMSANGGVERVLFERGGPQGPVRWSPDGKWVYFSQPSQVQGAPYVISRVSIDGGEPTPMTSPVTEPFPGLTLDGRYIVVPTHEAGTGITFGIFDLEKRLIASVKVANEPIGEPWNFIWSGDGMHMIYGLATGDVSLRARAIAGGVDREISLGGRFPRFPSLSPDGKRVALPLTGDSTIWEQAVMNLDGTDRRVLAAIPVQSLAEPRWSPDGRFVAFWQDGYKSLFITDLTTGKSTRVANAELDIRDFRWQPDSRAIRYIRVAGIPTKQKLSVNETNLDGQDRLVLDLAPYMPSEGIQGSGWAGARFFGDAVALIGQGLVVPLTGGDAVRIYEPLTTPRRWRTVSENGRWVGLIAEDRNSIEVIQADGSGRYTVQVPGGGTVAMTPVRQKSQEGFVFATSSTPTTQASLYLIPFNGGPLRSLLALPAGESFNDISLSSDGRTLVYGRLGVPTLHLADVDLGVGLRSRGATRE